MDALSEIDYAIIAEEHGWEYVPACDEGILAIWEEETIEFTPEPIPPVKIDRRKLRAALIRETMPLVRDEEDWQGIQNDIFQDDRAISAWPDDEKREEIARGVFRFCSWACGHDRW